MIAAILFVHYNYLMKLFYSNHLAQNIRGRNTSHLLLNKVLQEYYHINPEAIRRPDRGKPFLENGAGPHFSVSHTGTLWLCAVTDHEIGIDAERMNRPVAQPLKLAERYFSDEEYRFIAAASENLRLPQSEHTEKIERFQWERIIPGRNTDSMTVQERLLLIWTRKEANLKYSGIGLRDLTASGSVLSDLNSLSIRSYRNGSLLFSVCAGSEYHREAISEYIDLDSGKVHRNVRFFKRKNT